MAVEVEAAGQVDEFLRVLKRRIWWIIIPAVVIGSLGSFFAVVVPKKYVAETHIMVGNPGAAGLASAGSPESEGVVAQFSIRAITRIESVLDDLNWTDFKPLPQEDRYSYILELQKGLRVKLPTMPRGSGKQRVEISFKSTSRARAKEFLSQLFRSWKEEVLQSQLQSEKNLERETRSLLEDHRSEYRRLGERVRSLRTEFNIAPPRVGPDGRIVETTPQVYQETVSLEQEIVALEQSLDQTKTELEKMRKRHDRMPLEAEASERKLDPSEALIEGIEDRLEQLEIEQTTSNLSQQHSDFKRREQLIRDLRDKRDLLRQRSRGSSGLEPGAMVENPRRIALGEQIQEFEDTVTAIMAKITRRRDRLKEVQGRAFRLTQADAEIRDLSTEMASLSARISEAALRADDHGLKVSQLETPAGNPFEVQLAPTVPRTPDDPNPWVIGIGSIVFGLGLGLGLAVLKEYGKSVFRSPRDYSRVIPYPVLGTINSIKTRRERARAVLIRAVLGGGSLLFLLSVSYVTWAWAMNRDGLTDSLVDAISGFREMLM